MPTYGTFVSMILQLNPWIEVVTVHGAGWAMFIIDYGLNLNSCWVVVTKKDGRIRHYDSNDVTVDVNYTYKINVQKIENR